MSFCVIVYLNLLIAYWPFVGDLSHSLNRGYGDNNNGTSGGTAVNHYHAGYDVHLRFQNHSVPVTEHLSIQIYD